VALDAPVADAVLVLDSPLALLLSPAPWPWGEAASEVDEAAPRDVASWREPPSAADEASDPGEHADTTNALSGKTRTRSARGES
jgi:hypothetical protein